MNLVLVTGITWVMIPMEAYDNTRLDRTYWYVTLLMRLERKHSFILVWRCSDLVWSVSSFHDLIGDGWAHHTLSLSKKRSEENLRVQLSPMCKGSVRLR